MTDMLFKIMSLEHKGSKLSKFEFEPVLQAFESPLQYRLQRGFKIEAVSHSADKKMHSRL